MADRDFCSKDGRWFIVSFEMADALAKHHLDSAEMSVLLCVMRYAYPYQRPWADIKFGFLLEYTELSKGTVYKATAKLMRRNILKIGFPQETKMIKRYRINSKISTWKKVSPARRFPPGNQKVSPERTHLIKEKINKNNGNSFPKKKKKLPWDPFFINFATDVLRTKGKDEALLYCKSIGMNPGEIGL